MQVVIEDRNLQGGLIGSSAVDFLIQMVDVGTNHAPFCTFAPPPGPFDISIGQPFSFVFSGHDLDAGESLVLNSGGLPPGATMSPQLPMLGTSGVSATFNWTPA